MTEITNEDFAEQTQTMNTSSNSVIEVKDLTFSYGAENVLKQLSLTLEPGTVMGLLGENGSGKTSLLNCLLGFLKPQSGSAQIFGESSRELSTAARQRLAFVPQTNDLGLVSLHSASTRTRLSSPALYGPAPHTRRLPNSSMFLWSRAKRPSAIAARACSSRLR